MRSPCSLPERCGRSATGTWRCCCTPYLLAIGLGTLEVGILSTATLARIGAGATLAVGAWGHRFASDRLLEGGGDSDGGHRTWALQACLSFWPLLIVAFVGTLNPSSGDVSVFLPLEHARLARAAEGNARTVLFARYSVLGALCAAVRRARRRAARRAGGQAGGFERLDVLRAMLVFYGALGAGWGFLALSEDRGHSMRPCQQGRYSAARTVASRGRPLLAALFLSVDAFAGGLIVNALLALWLFERFGISPPRRSLLSGPDCSARHRNCWRPRSPAASG